MIVVRQRMIKRSLSLLVTLLMLSSCNPTTIQGSNVKSNVVANDGSYDGKAFIYRDNPSILAGPQYGPRNPDMGSIMDGLRAELITTNTQLNGNCSIEFFFFGTYPAEVSNCIRSLKNHDNLQSLSRKADKTWMYEPGTSEFYQTNSLYHIQKGVNTFYDKLQFAYDRIHSLSFSMPKSIPSYLKDSKMYWFKGVSNTDSKLFKNDYLNAFAQCNEDKNAYFSPAGPELCFGYHSSFPGFYFVQDPTVIYHELGHGLVSLMMNLRNGTSSSVQHKLRSNLGSFGYDEAGAINEGIADYFSFVMNKRTHLGEWAMGKTAKQSRPMVESDSVHITGIAETSEGRLSYPQFLLYDPNYPDSPYEDVHYAGQIVSHYLVALTKSFKNKCGISSESNGGHDAATSYVMMLVAETLSEIGDLNAKGVDDFGSPFVLNIFFNNLNPNDSYLWSQVINQTTYRRFFQILAKNIYKYITPSIGGLCPAFTKNDSEKLLDDYGLLLFKTYNDNGNSSTDRTVTYTDAVSFIPSQPLTSVTETNRRKSVLVSKELLSLAEKTDSTPDVISYYIIDNRSDMESLLQDLLFKGLSVPISSEVASIDYNNGNIKISPGEIIAVIPNLHNSSNSVMAGVQLLANDWDHAHITDSATGNYKPCVFDETTTVDQGGEAGNTCLAANGYPDKDYKRLVKDPVTKLFPTDAAAPVCLVQMADDTSTRWVSQNEFRKKQGLSLVDKDCLGYTTSGTSDSDFTFNPHECLVRFLPGATDAFFSKIDPQKNYYESVVKISDTMQFNSGNLLLMEVNRWIPPGTKFRCRLRARFSNCSDCYHDATNGNDDYLDSDYNGNKPFKIINFEFDVND
jgi:hypothetical protein